MNYGPVFGSGHDLAICDEAHVQANSFCDFPTSFMAGYNKGQESIRAFSGQSRGSSFRLLEWEVFEILFDEHWWCILLRVNIFMFRSVSTLTNWIYRHSTTKKSYYQEPLDLSCSQGTFKVICATYVVLRSTDREEEKLGSTAWIQCQVADIRSQGHRLYVYSRLEWEEWWLEDTKDQSISTHQHASFQLDSPLCRTVLWGSQGL